MSTVNITTRNFIKSLAPVSAEHLIEKYKLPSPYKEVLTACCILGLQERPAIEWLGKEKHLYLSVWQYRRRLSEGLIKFRKAHIQCGCRLDI